MKASRQHSTLDTARFADPRRFKVGRNRTRLRSLALDVTRAIEDGAPIEMLMFTLGPKIVMELKDGDDDHLIGLINSAANAEQARIFRTLVYGQAGRALDGGHWEKNVTAVVLFGIPLTLQLHGQTPIQLQIADKLSGESVQRAFECGHLIGEEAFLLPSLYRHEDLDALTPCAIHSLAEFWASGPPDTEIPTNELPIIKPSSFGDLTEAAQLRYMVGVLRGAPKKPPEVDYESTQDRFIDENIERFSDATGARVVVGPVRELVTALHDGTSMLRAARLSEFLTKQSASTYTNRLAVVGTKNGIADNLFVRVANGQEVALPLRQTDNLDETLASLEQLVVGHDYAFDIATDSEV